MGILLKTACGFAAPADRDDLVQDMLIAIWQALPSFDGRSSISTFVYRVAHNRALNWNRTTTRYRRKIAAWQCEAHLALAPEANHTEEKLEWLYAIIRRLPPGDRTLLMLHLERLSHQEIADVTGLTVGNIGVRMHRIRRWLAEQKGEHDDAR
jgi:RNA polymerase sigma factor (sigma-70 family)